MSEVRSRSPAARFVAVDWNATQCGLVGIEPSSDGLVESPLACLPLELIETRCSEPPSRSRIRPSVPRGRCQTKTSLRPLVSPATRFVALEWNAAMRVLRLSPETVAPPESPLAGLREAPTEIGSGLVPNMWWCRREKI